MFTNKSCNCENYKMFLINIYFLLGRKKFDRKIELHPQKNRVRKDIKFLKPHIKTSITSMSFSILFDYVVIMYVGVLKRNYL